MQPGQLFFEHFGHDAIIVADPISGQSLSYNFGYFDPLEPDFLGRVIRGEMLYYLISLPLEEDLDEYRNTGRSITINGWTCPLNKPSHSHRHWKFAASQSMPAITTTSSLPTAPQCCATAWTRRWAAH